MTFTDSESPHPPRVVIVDDEVALVRSLTRVLEQTGFECLNTCGASGLRDHLRSNPELVLLDLNLGEESGICLIDEVRGQSPDTEVIVMTGYASVDSVVESMRAGAFDYLEKPFREPHLVVKTLERALERRSLQLRNRELGVELDRRSTLDGIVCQSASMKRVVHTVRELDRNESNILIQAERGPGKEVGARAIHETSARREGPVVPVDCGALPESIAEGELFGFERGAFTGAVRAKAGLFRSASGGTLFLDEIGELVPPLQSKLLRALQEREVRPLGGAISVPIDVRIIAATNRDLATEVAAGRFRRDLFYRLRVVPVEIPPLRERPEDIPVLAMHFLERYGAQSSIRGFEPEALELLMGQPWIGNVRELENSIEAALAFAPGPRIRARDLEIDKRAGEPALPNSEAGSIELSLAAYERACLEAALVRTHGSAARAARLLGVGRSTLYRKLARHGINPADAPPES